MSCTQNPPIPRNEKFSLTPQQKQLEIDYKKYLLENFQIEFNNLFTITNLPIGRIKNYLEYANLYTPYLKFLETHHNNDTLTNLMCRNQLSIDYLENIFDCDFNQMENINSTTEKGEKLTVTHLLEADNLDLITKIKIANYCYGCTAGSGSSCGGALL